MKIKTGKHDTLIIAIIVIIVAVFYLFLYFQGGLPIAQPDSGPPPIFPQPVGIDPVTQSVNTGDTVSVKVVNNDAKNLFGFQFDMNYDPAILEFQSVEQGGLLKTGGVTIFCVPFKTDNPGLIKNVACTRMGQVGEVEGVGTMMEVIFTAKSSGTSDIELTNVKLSDINANELTPETFSGEVIVG
jgi:hypothetical protein